MKNLLLVLLFVPLSSFGQEYKVIFISPSFNSYQKNSVNFQDVPFELWEITRYENNNISLLSLL